MGSPILIYEPVGGTPSGELPAPSPLPGTGITNAGVTQLVNGQSYIDVVFDHVQTDNTWIFVECSVMNIVEPDALNIWPGMTTSKLTTGFRLQLNGMPDSDNYFLNWAVSGINVVPTPATAYILSGPLSGVIGAPATFTVHLPSSTTVPSTVTVTLSDGVGGGTFSSATVTLTTGAPSTTFTYTPNSSGIKTISVINDGGLLNPADITFTVSAATGYSMSGPSGGTVSVASTDFTLTLTPLGYGVVSPVTVTPDDAGAGGTFTPATVELTTGAPSATFTYTPASSGAKTINATNDGSLTDPDSLTYTVSAAPLSDGDPVSTWPDSSGNGNDATMTGSNRPTFKTNIVNGKPVVRFTSAGFSKLDLTTPISGAFPWIVFAVMKQATGADTIYGLAGSDGGSPRGGLIAGGGTPYFFSRYGYMPATAPVTLAFHIIQGICGAAPAGSHFLLADGASIGDGTLTAPTSTGDFTTIGYDIVPGYSNGDIAEIIVYNTNMSGTDRENIEKYLGTKYGISVPAGSAVQPDTVAGLVGWWRADSL